jgi:CRP/FNR family cyclic AMP-dependent transcriptional regulator
VNHHTKIWHLERIDILKDLSHEELGEMDRVTVMKTKEKGSYIYFPNEPSKVVFFLKAGRVKIGAYSKDGKEVIKTIVHPGDMFGELGLVGEDNRKDFAIAMDDEVRLCTLAVEEALGMMRNNADLGLKVSARIGDRLMKLERRFESLVFKDARTRIVEFVKNMALERGVKYADEIQLDLSLTHQDIANLTATSRQTVTTVLNELKEEKIINFDRQTILVHDIKKLI